MSTSVRVLHPGDIGFASRDERLDTLLGSCVAVMLTDPRHTVGAMCHIVHAGPGPDTRHAGPAFLQLAMGLVAMGVQPALCEAWVAGGGNLFPALVRGGSVGEHNVRAATDWLAALGVLVRGRFVGGPCYRRVRWTIGEDGPSIETHPV